jgi:asparagine N-glycosylation enzyme membrane subunit Stt3
MLREAVSGLLLSAAKIVFLMIALTACIAYATGKMETEQFMTLAMLSFSFYFGTPTSRSIDPNDPNAGGMMK